MNTSYTTSIKPRENYYNSKTLIMNIPMNGIGSKNLFRLQLFLEFYVIQSIDDMASKCKVHALH